MRFFHREETISLMALVCVTALVVMLPLSVFGTGNVEALMDQAIDGPEEATGTQLWNAFSESPEELVSALTGYTPGEMNKVLVTMEMAFPEQNAANYLAILYGLAADTPEQSRQALCRLILVLEMRVDSDLAYEDYALLMEKASYADGAYADLAAGQLAKAFQTSPKHFLENMAARKDRENLAMLLYFRLQLSGDYDLEAELDRLEPIATAEELICIQLLREKAVPETTAPTAKQEPEMTAPTESSGQAQGQPAVQDSEQKAAMPVWIPAVVLGLAAVLILLNRKK